MKIKHTVQCCQIKRNKTFLMCSQFAPRWARQSGHFLKPGSKIHLWIDHLSSVECQTDHLIYDGHLTPDLTGYLNSYKSRCLKCGWRGYQEGCPECEGAFDTWRRGENEIEMTIEGKCMYSDTFYSKLWWNCSSSWV